MFNSFVLAGFDCTVGRNKGRKVIDHIQATHHDRRIGEDYDALKRIGIKTVRDGAPWRPTDPAALRADWRHFDNIIEASQRHAIEVIHDLCHFGYPDALDVFSPTFVDAFGTYCYEVALRLKARADGPHFFTPLNEPSYFAWAGAHAGIFPPYACNRAVDMKVQLVRAALAGIEAIWSVLPNAHIINVDPICRAVAPFARPDLTTAAESFNTGAVLESWDMLCGTLLPELGGSPRHLGTIGVNYYWTNQWELGSEESPLADDDERRWSLHELVQSVSLRYRAPIVLTETGHIDGKRADWLRELVAQAAMILQDGVPLKGICLYPILGMPHWHDEGVWLNMGLWDVSADGCRSVCSAMLDPLGHLQNLSNAPLCVAQT